MYKITFSLFSDIPHFKEVVIMATVCDYCGHKTNEVKSGGGIEAKGKRISLKVTDVSDMSRDVLKVSTAANSFFEMPRVANIRSKPRKSK